MEERPPYFLTGNPETMEGYVQFMTYGYVKTKPFQTKETTFVNIRKDLVVHSTTLMEIVDTPRAKSSLVIPHQEIPYLSFPWKTNFKALLCVLDFLGHYLSYMKDAPSDNVQGILYKIFLLDKDSFLTSGAYDGHLVSQGYPATHVPFEQAVAIFNCVKWLNLHPLPYEVKQDTMKLEGDDRSPTLLDYMDGYIKERLKFLQELLQ